MDALGLIAMMGFTKKEEHSGKSAPDILRLLFEYMNFSPGELKKYNPEEDPYHVWKSLSIDFEAAEVRSIQRNSSDT